MASATLAERFWSKVDHSSGPDACWPWTGCCSEKGYGQIGAGGSARTALRAHRVAWELAAGEPVPDGLCVLHNCDNPPCVNPDHLWLGTNDDNVRDRNEKGRRARGESLSHTKLNPEAVKVIRFMRGRASCLLLGRLHAVHHTSISGIWLEKTWRSTGDT
jgi:hypothetical protein